jgi:hypothetical protein
MGLLATSAALCATTPQSYLDGTPQTKTDPQLYPVQIVAVDGDIQNTTPVAVTPGPHWLEILAAPGDPKRASKTQTFVLKIEPCTYYYLGAHKDSAVLDKWKLVVDEEDTIKACDPADELRKAKAASQVQGTFKPNPPH